MPARNTCLVCGKEYFAARKRIESGASKYCSNKCSSIGKYPRFEDRFVINDQTGCHEWVYSKSGSGYGAISHEGRMIGAHRYAWIKANGEIPEGMLVLHRCDNRACVNHEHLFLGTVKDNSDDMISKGRGAWQARAKVEGRIGPDGRCSAPAAQSRRRNPHGSSNSILKTEDVVQIKAMLQEGRRRADIAKIFGVSQATITSINTGYRWAHLAI